MIPVSFIDRCTHHIKKLTALLFTINICTEQQVKWLLSILRSWPSYTLINSVDSDQRRLVWCKWDINCKPHPQVYVFPIKIYLIYVLHSVLCTCLSSFWRPLCSVSRQCPPTFHRGRRNIDVYYKPTSIDYSWLTRLQKRRTTHYKTVK